MDHTLRIVILVVIAFQCALSMVIGHREAVNADGQMQISQQSKPQRRMSMVSSGSRRNSGLLGRPRYKMLRLLSVITPVKSLVYCSGKSLGPFPTKSTVFQ